MFFFFSNWTGKMIEAICLSATCKIGVVLQGWFSVGLNYCPTKYNFCIDQLSTEWTFIATFVPSHHIKGWSHLLSAGKNYCLLAADLPGSTGDDVLLAIREMNCLTNDRSYEWLFMEPFPPHPIRNIDQYTGFFYGELNGLLFVNRCSNGQLSARKRLKGDISYF